jgi:YbbR domain-containing protein
MSKMLNKKTNTRIISVMFAVALWLYVASEQNPTEYRNIKDVPVRLMNVEAVNTSGLVIRDPQDYKVDITLQGKRSILSEIKAGDIIADADLRGHSQKGVNNVPVEIKGLPTNIELVDFNPKIVKVNMEQVISIQVPVNLSIEGRPQQGYTTLEPVITPGEVLVKGPESLLGNLKVVTAVMKLAQASDDLHEVLPVKAVDGDDSDIAGVAVNPNVVEVTIPVRKTKEVAIEPVMEGQPAEGWEITEVYQNRDTIVIYGEEAVLQDIHSVRTRPVVLTGMNENTSFNVDIIMPEGTSPVGDISAITVYVRGERWINKEFSIDRISFTGIRRGLSLSEETELPVVRVVLQGRQSVIDGIGVGDISITADLEGQGAGKHSVTLMVDLPEGAQLVSMEPQQVQIELTAPDQEQSEE